MKHDREPEWFLINDLYHKTDWVSREMTSLLFLECTNLTHNRSIPLTLSFCTTGLQQDGPSARAPPAAIDPRDPRRLLQAAQAELSPATPTFNKDSPELCVVKTAIEARTRPTEQNRRTMVSTLTETLRKLPRYNHDMARAVADQLVQLYPHSFKDQLPNPRNPIGSDSLRRNFVNCLDNKNRGPARQARDSALNPPIPKAHGCSNWSPPINEEEELQMIQEEMKTEFSATAAAHWNMEQIRENMKLTYPLQRRDLNQGISRSTSKKAATPAEPTLPARTIRQNWPFLFTYGGMDVHFKELTNVSFNERFVEWTNRNGKDVIRLMASKGDDYQKVVSYIDRAKARNSCPDPEVRGLMFLLLIFFNESRKTVFYRAEVRNVL